METDSLYLVPSEQRLLYGSGLLLLATNNPYALPTIAQLREPWGPQKTVVGMNCSPEFVAAYARIEPAIRILLQRHYAIHKGAWWIRPQRFGFDDQEKPLVLQLIGTHSTDGEALDILKEVVALVSAEGEALRNVYVDVCIWSETKIELRDDPTIKGHNLSTNAVSYIYNNEVPLPGSSIGPKGGNLAGTLCGYVMCNNEIFGLTNAHVVDQSLPTPYDYNKGMAPIMITSPADKDHKATMKGLEDLVNDWIESARKKTTPKKTEDIQKFTKFSEMATKYDTELGYVYASSGIDESGEHYSGRLDWALIRCDRIRGSKMKNKHCPFNNDNTPNGFELDPDALEYIRDQHSFNYADAKEYFEPGPAFKPVLDINNQDLVGDVFLKPPNRSLMGWKDAVHNGIHHTFINESITVEDHCFISQSNRDRFVTTHGDSGSVLINIENRPSFMVWGGMKSPIDFTYATPLTAILKDIERVLDLPEGSVQFC